MSLTEQGMEEHGVEVYRIGVDGAQRVPTAELSDVLADPDALVWVDIPQCDGGAAMALSEIFHFHDIAIRDSHDRNHISKLHVYNNHVFTVSHAPEIGDRGHVH